MHKLLNFCFLALYLSQGNAAPAGTPSSVASSPNASPTDPYASDDPNGRLWAPDAHIIPEAIRGPYGASILGPQNIPIALEEADLFAPPTTDHGNVYDNFYLTIHDMSIAKQMAGVDMRLEAGAIRIPEIFGIFLQLTDWLAHVPKEVLAKNFQTDIAAFNHIPSQELYIFPSVPPADDQQPPVSPYGQPPEPYTYEFSKVPATQLQGGTVKIADSTTFKVAKTLAVAEITIEPGAIRELHWHPTQDEWAFIMYVTTIITRIPLITISSFSEGQARMTLFAAQSNARTWDYEVRGMHELGSSDN
ncbi:hypothetical protein PHLCEN_2v9057 [Hermanssonia centrifuga]|uniref:Cupin type-1 domain-containing protein n=1 Tax=Hermanssonia centrifuga TaxID=98765 RepID=A0A2R6NRX7_9APHY|nr:hypothetical protein PHLCEN_2v9057 [Hermanssonia centrifuga]